ncbi:hypothetical protein E2C01_091865 [Portunus trituberculatus]|uniref:Uncharacterized protein n=1 Tax=Portunus trituberculatus TaxID=210409 RepID=A0A5B7JU41_PORTR|nr:hypothetical protein [Portunus trituberculatus]
MVPKQRVYGHQQPNGSWTGLIGLLQRQGPPWYSGTMLCFGVRGVSKRTGSNPVHGPSEGWAFSLGVTVS